VLTSIYGIRYIIQSLLQLQAPALPQNSPHFLTRQISCRIKILLRTRKYTNGSVLRMHVDTVNTHVVSAIINVDQEVDEDWPLIILDHDDKEHAVMMQPGDMLLYESAKNLHGRPGRYLLFLLSAYIHQLVAHPLRFVLFYRQIHLWVLIMIISSFTTSLSLVGTMAGCKKLF
jgi:hypothetical protein